VNGGSFASIASYPDTIPNLIAGTYTVVVRDVNLCQHTSLITVNSLGGITAVSSATQNAQCVPPNSGSITLNSVTGGTGPYQVSLDGSSFTTMPGFPYTASGLTAGVYTITVQDAAGCPNTSTVTVGSTSGPTNATISTLSDTCGRSVGTLTVTNVVGGTPAYQYSINGGTNQASNIFTGLATGNYTVLVTDNNGCTFVHYDSVKTVGPTVSPIITASGPVTFCQGGSVTLSSSIANGNTWNTGATTQTITVNSTDTLSLTVSQFGCTVNSNTVIVTVNPNPTVTVSNAVTICDGTSTTLIAGGATNYTWSPATGLSSTTSATVTATPGVSGTYTYMVNATDANSCPGSNTVIVTVAPAPSGVPLVTTPVYYCLHQTATALTATASPGATLNWYDASMNPLSGAPTPATSPMGTTTYYVTQSIGSCTSGKDSIKVTVVAQPDANFTTNPSVGSVLAAQSVTFTPNQLPASYLTFTWDFGDPSSGTSNTSALFNPSHTYNSQGLYCAALVVTSSLTPTCPAANTLCLDVLNGIEITIPNVFSPNGDGINDFFSVKSSGLNTLSCAIYDRWGLKLYQWDGVNGHWDGTEMKNGKGVTDGTYYYIIETTDIKKASNKHEGYIQLIR
jgi:gliding motility-associated-like protein